MQYIENELRIASLYMGNIQSYKMQWKIVDSGDYYRYMPWRPIKYFIPWFCLTILVWDHCKIKLRHRVEMQRNFYLFLFMSLISVHWTIGVENMEISVYTFCRRCRIYLSVTEIITFLLLNHVWLVAKRNYWKVSHLFLLCTTVGADSRINSRASQELRWKELLALRKVMDSGIPKEYRLKA